MLVLQDYFADSQAPSVNGDPLFGNYREFEEIDFNSDVFNFLIYAGSTDYHYTLGFNTMRLLDVLEVDYKPSLLKHPEKALHQYLEDYLKAKSMD